MEVSQTLAEKQKSTGNDSTGEQRSSAAVIPLPPLESGDRLTREEFERRYEAMPEVKKAELINGVVYMGSPVRFRAHGRPHVLLLTWLGTYSALTPGVLCADNAPFASGPTASRSRRDADFAEAVGQHSRFDL